jgi:hypothetical protein
MLFFHGQFHRKCFAPWFIGFNITIAELPFVFLFLISRNANSTGHRFGVNFQRVQIRLFPIGRFLPIHFLYEFIAGL